MNVYPEGENINVNICTRNATDISDNELNSINIAQDNMCFVCAEIENDNYLGPTVISCENRDEINC